MQVYAFAMHMQALAMVAGGSVTVLSHPSLAGIARARVSRARPPGTAHFGSGNTSRASRPDDGEQPENDLRELEFKKNQYGPIGETIVLRYQRGLFLPEAEFPSLDKVAREQKAEEVFLDLLHDMTAKAATSATRQHRTTMRRPASAKRVRRKVCARPT